jgi:hypothetical protein
MKVFLLLLLWMMMYGTLHTLWRADSHEWCWIYRYEAEWLGVAVFWYLMPLSAQAQTSLYIDDNHLSIMAECESGGARSMSLLEKVILKGCCFMSDLIELRRLWLSHLLSLFPKAPGVSRLISSPPCVFDWIEIRSVLILLLWPLGTS